MTLEERGQMARTLSDNGWRVSQERPLEKGWMLGELRLDRALKVFKNSATKQGQSEQQIDNLSGDMDGLATVQKTLDYLAEIVAMILPANGFARMQIEQARRKLQALRDDAEPDVWDRATELQHHVAALKESLIELAAQELERAVDAFSVLAAFQSLQAVREMVGQ